MQRAADHEALTEGHEPISSTSQIDPHDLWRWPWGILTVTMLGLGAGFILLAIYLVKKGRKFQITRPASLPENRRTYAGIPWMFIQVYAVFALIALAWSITVALGCDQKAVSLAALIGWGIIPPSWFFFEHYYFFPNFGAAGPEAFEYYKHGRSTAEKLWLVGFVIIGASMKGWQF